MLLCERARRAEIEMIDAARWSFDGFGEIELNKVWVISWDRCISLVKHIYLVNNTVNYCNLFLFQVSDLPT